MSEQAGPLLGPPPRGGPIKGSFHLQFHPPGDCPISVMEQADVIGCLTGTADGDLSGDVLIQVFDSLVIQSESRDGFVSASTATISISRPDGVLRGVAAGLLDRTSGEFRNTVFWTGGTGPYDEADGYIRTDGHDTPEGVEHSDYRGYLYLPKREGA